MEQQTIPLTWKEKLTPMLVGEGLPVDKNNTSAVYTAIRVNFTESKDPEFNSREYSIRTSKDQSVNVWRIK